MGVLPNKLFRIGNSHPNDRKAAGLTRLSLGPQCIHRFAHSVGRDQENHHLFKGN